MLILRLFSVTANPKSRIRLPVIRKQNFDEWGRGTCRNLKSEIVKVRKLIDNQRDLMAIREDQDLMAIREDQDLVAIMEVQGLEAAMRMNPYHSQRLLKRLFFPKI
ncbi:hypothetical protein ACTXT7_001793 [Hymenolepis weldensis]